MRPSMRWAAALGFSILVWGGVLATPPAEERGDTRTVTGEIEVASVDDDGHTTSVSLYESKYGEILIASKGRGKELLDRVGSLVRVTGQLTRMKDSAGFDYVLRVSDYVVLEVADTEGYDSDPDSDDP